MGIPSEFRDDVKGEGRGQRAEGETGTSDARAERQTGTGSDKEEQIGVDGDGGGWETREQRDGRRGLPPQGGNVLREDSSEIARSWTVSLASAPESESPFGSPGTDAVAQRMGNHRSFLAIQSLMA